MIKILRKSWQQVAAVMLAVVMLATPAIAGVATANVTGLFSGNGLLYRDKKSNEVGPEAKKLGVRSYKVETDGDITIVNYTHESAAKGGVLRINRYDREYLALELRNSKGLSSIEWDLPNGKFTYIDTKGRSAVFKYNSTERKWSADSDLSKNIVDENKFDIALMAAIAADFDPIIRTKPAETSSEIQMQQSLCSDYEHPVVGSSVATTRSLGCYKARQDAAPKCSNQWCIGCHEYLSCDCACGIGDYFCICSIIGFPCEPCY